MFSPDFYPTPPEVIEQMTTGLDLHGKKVLEPSAGNGNIVDYVKIFGAEVIACEKHPDLARIVASKCQLIEYDFLTLQPDQVTHIDFIIMNPPFSNEEKHILHAWEIAPGGCQIISLFNHNSICGGYRTENQIKILQLVDQHGYKENLGCVFSTADRETRIDIGMLKLFKPKADPDLEFESYFDLEERFDSKQDIGIIKYDKLQELVSRYVGAVKLFDETVAATSKMNNMIDPIGSFANIRFGALKTDRHGSVQHVTKDQFRKSLQKSAWRVVFKMCNLEKHVTSKIVGELDRFIEKQENFPFTLNNIYKMGEMIVGTSPDRMNRVLVEAFDHICSLSSENSEAGKGWKTNSNYKINQRFIDTWVCEYDTRWPTNHVKIRCGHRDETMTDIIKGLCYLTGKNFEQVNAREYIDHKGRPQLANNSLYSFFRDNETDWGKWVQWNDFFRVRGYKKGTMHFEFVDEKVWEQFNLRVAKIKGWALPTKTDNKKKGTERTKETEPELFV